jgi:hypothetical protein
MFGFICVALMLLWTRYQQSTGVVLAPRRGRKRPQLDGVILPQATDSFTLEFEVCNGFTNQRIALLSGELSRTCRTKTGLQHGRAPNMCVPVCGAGLVLAAEANRSLVLPDFLLNGMQPDGIEMVTANQADTVPFGWVTGAGIRIMNRT